MARSSTPRRPVRDNGRRRPGSGERPCKLLGGNQAAAPVSSWSSFAGRKPRWRRRKASSSVSFSTAVRTSRKGGTVARVVVQAAPAAALEVARAQLLLELLEVPLDAPPQLRGRDQLLQRGRLGQGREPVVRRLLLAPGPLRQEPLLRARLGQPEVVVRRPDPHHRKRRDQSESAGRGING